MPSRDSTPGILLIGHGTASHAGTRQFLATAGQLAKRMSPAAVEPAFLELQSPDILAGLRRLHERGARQIVVAPLLLFAAGHAKEDIPAAVHEAVAQLGEPMPSVVQAAHLGCHPAIVRLSRRRLAEALAGEPATGADSTALVLIGRGSRGEAATAEMREFAHLTHEPATARDVFVGFLAMAQPLLSELLPDVASRGYRRIIVQPHLLFAGDLADTLQREFAVARQRSPGPEWVLAPLLADSLDDKTQDSRPSGNEFLLQALADRVAAASIHVVATGVDH